jgi:DNA topoisomerase-2
MDDSMDDILDDSVDSGGYSPPAKPAKVTKPKAAPKKAAAATKPRAAAKPKATKAAPKKKAKDDSDVENSDVDMGDDGHDVDESLLVDTPPKQKKATAPKKTSGKQALASIANESIVGEDMDEQMSAAAAKKAAGGASSKYQMVSIWKRNARSHYSHMRS